MTLFLIGLGIVAVGLVVQVVAGSRATDTATLTRLDFIGMGLAVGGGLVVGVGCLVVGATR